MRTSASHVLQRPLKDPRPVYGVVSHSRKEAPLTGEIGLETTRGTVLFLAMGVVSNELEETTSKKRT